LAGYGDLSLITKKIALDADAALSSSLAARLATEEGARAAADTANSSSFAARIATEEAARAAADTALSASAAAAIATEKGRIDAILSASTADVDTFAEVVALINSVDTTNDTAFASYVLSNDAALAAEVAAREAADTANSASFAAAMTTEIADRIAGDAAVSASLAAAVNNINQVAFDASASLAASITAEEAARIADVDAEEARAMAAEAVLSASIATEAADRATAVTNLSASFETALAAEIAAREAADATLTQNVADILANTDITAIDSFKEVINEINAVSAANFDAVYAKKNTVTAAPNGTITAFTFTNAVKAGSEQVYLNGQLLDTDGDYTVNTANGMVTGITFGVAPATADKLMFYGVYGTLSTVSNAGL
jgi:hypothetical protein